MFGLGASLDLFAEVGVEVIESRVLSLARRLVSGLGAKGFEVVGPQSEDPRSAIVSVALPTEAARGRFTDAIVSSGTRCAVRESRVRLSPHFYNTEDEVDRLLACL